MSIFNTLSSSISAMQSFSQGLGVIGNNIANVNTTGYKSADINFADSFSNSLRAASLSNAATANTTSMQVGTGVQIASIDNKFTQGALTSTGTPTDLGISGNGFFLLEDPSTQVQYATRAGDFRFDDRGYLVSNTGQRVMGLAGGDVGNAPTAEGAIQIGQSSKGTPVSFSFDKTGQLVEFFEDGSSLVTAQVQLIDFTDPLALTKQGNGLYAGFDTAGLQTAETPGQNGRGVIQASTLELSNVDLTKEFANMIGMQRSFQANSRLVTVSDGVMEEIVNLKR
jgi:flagellar hook protein FlgE